MVLWPPCRTHGRLIISAPADRLSHLLDEVEFTDRVGLDVFGIREHHRAESLESHSYAFGPQTNRLTLLLPIRYRFPGSTFGI